MVMSDMKKIIIVFALILCLILTGCAVTDNPGGKLCQIEFISAETQEVVKTLESQSQKEALAVLQVDEWETIEKPEGELIPEYTIVVYQQKTPQLLSFLNDESEYIQILEFTTYKESNIIFQRIDTGDFVETSMLPELSISVYYQVSDDILEAIYEGLARE